jgi:VanZ family protein
VETRRSDLLSGVGVASPRKLLGRGLALFCGLAIYGSFVPFDFQPRPFSAAVEEFAAAFFTPWWRLDGLSDLGANVLLFAPVGYFALGLLTSGRERGGSAAGAILLVNVSSLALSILLEFGQLWCPHRDASWRDVAAQLAGCLSGCVMWSATGERTIAWMGRWQTSAVGGPRLVAFLPWYALGLALYRVSPLDLTISPAQLVRKYRKGRIVLMPFADTPDWESFSRAMFDGLLCLPLGMFIAVMFRQENNQSRLLRTVRWLLPALVAGLYELAQLPVYSRYCSMTHAILGTLFAWCGMLLMDRKLSTSSHPASDERRGKPWQWCVVTVACAAIVFAISCFPFDWNGDVVAAELRWRGMWRVPFAALLRGSELNVTSIFVEKLAMFAPLGLLGWRFVHSLGGRPTGRRWYLLGWLVCCMAFAFLIELAQVYLPSRTPDASDALLAGFGCSLGMWIGNYWD